MFQSVDPNSFLPPAGLVGFLPPEDGTGIGKGFISYVVDAKANLPTGTEIRNVALISFDDQTIIATNQVDPQNPSLGTDPAKEALITIDAGTPSSRIDPLPAESESVVTLRWSGVDDPGGSGIGMYDVFVSRDGALYVTLLDDWQATFAEVTLEVGHSYRFYSVAEDQVGHVELPPALPDAETNILSADRTPPTVSIGDATPESRLEAVDQIVITFSEPVHGFDRTDLTLAWSVDETVFVDLAAATLTSTDSTTWILDHLSNVTMESGSYELRIVSAGAGITDSAGNPLAMGPSKTWFMLPGDADGDRHFDSSDFVYVFQRGEYEDSVTGNSTWSDGDWNGDGDFDSSDFVIAFQSGGYERDLLALPSRNLCSQNDLINQQSCAVADRNQRAGRQFFRGATSASANERETLLLRASMNASDSACPYRKLRPHCPVRCHVIWQDWPLG